MTAAYNPTQGRVTGTILRVDRAFEGIERWTLRLILAGIPLALGVYLLVSLDSRTFGMLSIAAGPIVLLAVLGVERILSRLGRAFDSTTDPLIAKAGGSRLRQALEEGRVQVLRGTVEAELSGGRLVARAGDLIVTIPSVRAAWRSTTSAHMVLAASRPGVRPDFTKCVLLPADGRIATAIAEAPPHVD